MAPIKQPLFMSKILIEYVKKWIYNLVKDIAENDHDGNYTKQIEARLTEMRNYLETWLPVRCEIFVFFYPLVPSKREKNVLVLLSLYIFFPQNYLLMTGNLYQIG